jgi:hypothetical protein
MWEEEKQYQPQPVPQEEPEESSDLVAGESGRGERVGRVPSPSRAAFPNPHVSTPINITT